MNSSRSTSFRPRTWLAVLGSVAAAGWLRADLEVGIRRLEAPAAVQTRRPAVDAGSGGGNPSSTFCDGGPCVPCEGGPCTGWQQSARMTFDDTQAGGGFGQGMARVGDDLFVGAPYEGLGDPMHGAPGAVHTFHKVAGTWVPEQHIVPPASEKNGEFGYAVAATADTLFIGAPNEKSVFVYRAAERLLAADPDADRLEHDVRDLPRSGGRSARRLRGK